MLSYPPTATGPDADDYHGELVADPYRWLEDTYSPQTAAWVQAQNEVTQSWLAGSADREAIRERLVKLADYPRYGVPFTRGRRWFQFRNSGLQDQPVLYVMDGPDDAGRLLLDPNTLAADGTVAVSGVSVSEDGSLLAYATSGSGSDWQTWRVRDTATGTDLDDVVEWAKSDDAAWRNDKSGFYYMAPEPPPPGGEYLAASGLRRILFHRIGTAQRDDEIIFSSPDHPDWYPSARVSDDGRFVIISVFSGTAPQAQVHVLDLTEPDAALRPLVADFDTIADVVSTQGSIVYLVTDYQAERKRLVAVDLARPDRAQWTQVVAQTPDTLLAAYRFGGKFVCHYLRNAHSVLRVHDADGTLAREIPLAGYASVADACKTSEGIAGREGSNLMHFGLTSFAESGSLWSHDLASGETALVRASTAALDPGRFTVEQVRVTSADGTELTMFVTRRDDVVPSGDVPALLYGYGGFDIAITPSFSLLHAAWLADSGWSRPGRIAISGGSNGGLLVGACLTQRPELFGACVPAVGVMDMLRFHKFTVGSAWIADFGSPDDPEQYRWLRAYSPLHNIRQGERYPATFVLTGDHDDRVVPGHSFKFAATMQASQGGDAPILIRIETSAGHGAGKPTSKVIAEAADVLAFLRLALGISGPVG